MTMTANRSLLDKPMCVLDTETTGLGAHAEVVQLAILDGKSGEVLFDQDFCPETPIDAGASAVHGLDHDRLAGAPRWPELFEEVWSLLKGRLAVAYNAPFDRRILDQTCDRYDLPRLDLAWACAMRGYARARGRRRSLRSACAAEGIPLASGDHSALEDARATWRLIRHLRDFLELT